MKYYPTFNELFENSANYALRTDIVEKDGFYHFDIEAPGAKKEDIHVDLKNGYLTIQINKNTEKEEKDESGNLIRQERFSGSCSRQFYVGDSLKPEDVKASYENGELKISLPTEENRPEHLNQMIEIH